MGESVGVMVADADMLTVMLTELLSLTVGVPLTLRLQVNELIFETKAVPPARVGLRRLQSPRVLWLAPWS